MLNTNRAGWEPEIYNLVNKGETLKTRGTQCHSVTEKRTVEDLDNTYI